VDANDVARAGSFITFSDPFNPAVTFTIKYADNFLPWSSNRWTLDFIIEQSYYKVAPSPTENPMDFTLRYYWSQLALAPAIQFIPFSLGFTQHHFFPLVQASVPYWADGTQN